LRVHKEISGNDFICELQRLFFFVEGGCLIYFNNIFYNNFRKYLIGGYSEGIVGEHFSLGLLVQDFIEETWESMKFIVDRSLNGDLGVLPFHNSVEKFNIDYHTKFQRH